MPTAHTPGPWHADVDCFETAVAIRTANGGYIAETWPQVDDFPPGKGIEYDAEGVANARLIAAAPQLLDALRDVMASLIDGGADRDPETGEQFDDCRAACEAITAATGQPWPPVLTEAEQQT